MPSPPLSKRCKTTPPKLLCQSDRFFHPLCLHGSWLLCTWVIPKGSSTHFWPPETHRTLEDKVRKNRQQLHLRAGAVKVAAKFEAMWKWQKRKRRTRMRAHLALVQVIIKESKEEDCKQYKNTKFIQNQLKPKSSVLKTLFPVCWSLASIFPRWPLCGIVKNSLENPKVFSPLTTIITETSFHIF